MTVEEIQAILPNAVTYELRPGAKYLVLADIHKVDNLTLSNLMTAMLTHNIICIGVAVYDTNDAVRLLEIK